VSSKTRDRIKFTLIGLWLALTVAFALWWLTFSIEHISLLEHLQPSNFSHWQRQRRMVIWEGTTWLVLLALGGAALIQLMRKERERARRIREFFASFSHEVKTSLASLRLQAEALTSDPAFADSEILERLVGDTVRLQLQLENSLFLASQESLKMHIRNLNMQKVMNRLNEQWPGIRIELERACEVQADERALHTILSNLIQNSVLHGGANHIVIVPRVGAQNKIVMEVRDNGRGYEGPREDLGRLFHRPKSTSGSGIGLYICRLLSEKMNGRLELPRASKGFRAELTLAGGIS
jgi:signal transduction histidine kinase